MNVEITNSKTVTNTLVVACNCTTSTSLTKQGMPRNSNAALARTWNNQVFCADCGDKFSLSECDIVEISFKYERDGLLGQSQKEDGCVAIVKNDTTANKLVSIVVIGRNVEEKYATRSNIDLDEDLVIAIKEAYRNYVNGDGLLK